jgi:hypothetical protein
VIRLLGPLSLAAILVGLGGILATEDAKAAKTHTVNGTADNVWEYTGMTSKVAKVGAPTDRLVIKVKPGDLVHFEVTGNKHGVIFENGKSQLKNGVFEVVKKTGELDLVDPQATGGLSLPAYYKKDDAKLTDRRDTGPIITIKIGKLEAGLDKGILFGCNPHSKPPANNNVKMLGVIVLDEGAASKK